MMIRRSPLSSRWPFQAIRSFWKFPARATKQNVSTKTHYQDFADLGFGPHFPQRFQKLVSTDSNQDVQLTEDQKKMLAILKTGNHLHMQGSSQSGKSLALLMFAINRAITRGHPSENFLDSVIVVPTDEMVYKYRHFAEQIGFGLNCGKINPNTQEEEYEPLAIEFLSSKKEGSFFWSTGPLKKLKMAHILVTTPTGLSKALETSEAVNRFRSIRFFAVDELDFQINAYDTGSNNINVQRKGKRFFVTKLEQGIHDVTTFQLRTLAAKVGNTLHDILMIANVPDINFDFARYVLDSDWKFKNPTSLPEHMGPEHNALLEKLFEAKSKIVYDPIQYCFISQAVHPALESLLPSNNRVGLINEMLRLHLADTRFHMSSRKLNILGEFVVSKNERTTEPQPKRANFYFAASKEGTVRRHNSRRNVSEIANLDNSYVDVSPRKIHEDLANKAKKGYFFGSNQKRFLRYMILNTNVIDEPKHYAEIIEDSIKKFRVTLNNNEPFLVVIPPFTPIEKVLLKMNSSESYQTFKRFVSLNEMDVPAVENHFKNKTSNLIVYPSNLIGQSFNGLQNLLVVSFDIMFPQLAFREDRRKPTIDLLEGIKSPSSDLLYWYVSKLMSSNLGNHESNMIFLVDQVYQRKGKRHAKKDKLVSERLQVLLTSNEIKDQVNFKEILPGTAPEEIKLPNKKKKQNKNREVESDNIPVNNL